MQNQLRRPAGPQGAKGAKEQGRNAAEVREWTGASALMDFDDPAVRAMARSIMNTQRSERDRALAAHAQVRALRLAFHHQARPVTAGVVLRRREGDAIDKATLLVALLRLCQLQARLLFTTPQPGALKGLPIDVCCGPRPMVEVCIDGQWLRTDTFIFDERYLRAAHHRLQQKQRECGYGVSASGAIHWDGLRSASVLGPAHAEGIDPDETRFNDAAEFARSRGLVQRVTQLGRWALWTAQRQRLVLTLRGLRSRQPVGRHHAEGVVSSLPA